MFRNGLQFWHIIVLLVVVLVLFGANRLPDVARSVGKSMKILKEEAKELREGSGDSSGNDASATPSGPAGDSGSSAPVSDDTPAAPPRDAGSSSR